jgi:autotransporter-associated beta strand protein
MNRLRNFILVPLIALASLPAVQAGHWSNESARMNMRGEDMPVFDLVTYPSYASMASVGPEWFRNALSSSTTRYLRAFTFDSAGDRLGSENGYVGTLRDVFDVGLFSNISPFVVTGAGKTSTTTPVNDLNNPKKWDGGGGNNSWNTATNWNADAKPITTDDVLLDNSLFTFAANTTLGLNAAFTIQSLTMNSAGLIGLDASTTSGANTLTLTNTPGLDLITIGSSSASTVTLGSSIATLTVSLTNAGNINVASGKTLIFGTLGKLSGAGDWTLTGSGTLVLTSTADNYTGSAIVKDGTLKLGGSGVLTDASALIVGSGGTLATFDLAGFNETVGILSGDSTGMITNSLASSTSVLTTSFASGNQTYSGAIQDGGVGKVVALTKLGGGSLTLSGTNTYSGTTTLTTGTLIAGSDSAFGSGIFSLNGGTIQASGGDRSLANTFTLNASGTVSGSENLIFTGAFTESGNSRTLTSSITSGKTFTLAGNVFLANDNTTGRTLTINGTGATVVSGTIANNASGNSIASSLIYSGTGSLTLSSANTYTGTTRIDSGTVTVKNTTGSATGSGTVNFNNASGTTAILASGAGTTGIISGRVNTNNTDSTISPGGAGTVGALTLNGGLTASNGGTFIFDLGSTSNHDLISLGSGLFTGPAGTASGVLQMTFNALSGVTANTTYQLFTYGSKASLDPGDFSMINSPAFSGAVFTVTGTEVDVTFSEVPEPGTWIGAALALLAVGYTQRKRFAKRSQRQTS